MDCSAASDFLWSFSCVSSWIELGDFKVVCVVAGPMM